jgi:hypothetical protein
MHHPEQGETPPKLATYEVTIPADQNEQLLALTGLAGALGWDLRQVTPPGSDGEIVHAGVFYDTSKELFGSGHYGETAASIVQEDANRVRGSIEVRDGRIQFDSSYWNPRRGLGDHTLAPLGTSRADLMELAVKRFDQRNFPVNIGFTEAHNRYDFEKKILDIVPLEITREKLARFIESRDLHEHELHGLIGKALDVLNVVAGIAEPRSTEPYVEGDFISMKQLGALAREHGVSSTSMKSLQSRLAYALIDQFRTGRPQDKVGREIVVEGSYDATQWYSSKLGSLSVGLTSLVHLAETASTRAKYPAFLKEVPQLVAA